MDFFAIVQPHVAFFENDDGNGVGAVLHACFDVDEFIAQSFDHGRDFFLDFQYFLFHNRSFIRIRASRQGSLSLSMLA